MNTWDRHLIKLFFFTFTWITVSVFAIYACSDYLFKAQHFNQRYALITEFYSLRAIPYFLISMPVVAFLSQMIISYQLHKRHEWHLVKLVCLSNLKVAKALLLSGPILCFSWLIAREVVLPKIQLPLSETYQQVKGRAVFHHHVFSKDHVSIYITSENDHFKSIQATLLENKADLKKPTPLKWNHEEKTWTLDHPKDWSSENLAFAQNIIPSPKEIASRGEFYAYTSFMDLLFLLREDPQNQMLKTAFSERLLFPILFIFFFSLSAYHVLRCRQSKHTWIFPGMSLFIFSTTIMLFKSISLHANLLLGIGFVATSMALSPYLFSLYFRRKYKG